MKTILVCLCVSILSPLDLAAAATVFITGSDRGLGLEFVKQYAARGDFVIATCRHPDKATELQALAGEKMNVAVEALDVSDDASIRALAIKYRGKPIDVLINNAGVLGAHDDQTLGTFNRKGFADVMDVNAFAPLAITEAFRDNIVSSRQKKVVALTSGLGSIKLAGGMPKGPYYYRMSKAALNMGMQALGADLSSQNVSVAVVSPGVAETAMSTEFSAEYLGRKITAKPPAQSVAGMIAIIDKLDPSQGARGILNFDGTITTW
jgi:NAD(P)-dependent dehydrogenase (short-subunit alcohol dehydrogenase family)